MQQLGKRNEVIGVEKLQSIPVVGRPISMPHLRENEKVICGYDQGLGEILFTCESIDDMQQLYDAYYQGGALHIKWYKGEDPGFLWVAVD